MSFIQAITLHESVRMCVYAQVSSFSLYLFFFFFFLFVHGSVAETEASVRLFAWVCALAPVCGVLKGLRLIKEEPRGVSL